MRHFVHYIPILTTLLTIPFTVILYRHWRKKPTALYLAWWTLGIFTYGVGTLTESLTTLFGWQEGIFRAWYISGALLGGAPLAQGSLYLFVARKKAHRITTVLGYVEVLYVTELTGLLLIWLGYYMMVHDGGSSVHANQRAEALA